MAVGLTETRTIDGASSRLASVNGGSLGCEGKQPYRMYCINLGSDGPVAQGAYHRVENVGERYRLLVLKRTAVSHKTGKEIPWSGPS